MWDRSVRGLHRSHRRQAGALVPFARRCDRRARGHHNRGRGRHADRREGSAGLARPGSDPVRLLPVRSDHVGDGAAQCHAAPGRCRHRRRHGRQYLSVRHLRAHPGSHQARGGRGMTVRINLPVRPAEGSPRPSRRALFGMTSAVLIVGFCIPLRRAVEAAEAGAFSPNAFVRIDRQGDVTLVMPQVEMGQGTYTSISMILAEELDADWSRVRVEHAPPDEAHYANPMLTIQATGNSNSIRAWWTPLRKAGAAARACLVEAAAARWAVGVAACRTEAGEVIHDPTGRRLGYGDLAAR